MTSFIIIMLYLIANAIIGLIKTNQWKNYYKELNQISIGDLVFQYPKKPKKPNNLILAFFPALYFVKRLG